MRVEVPLFGPLADAAGVGRVAVQVSSDQPTAGEVPQTLVAMSPALHPQFGACRIAVNHAFAHDPTPIRETDEVALIGMASGEG